MSIANVVTQNNFFKDYDCRNREQKSIKQSVLKLAINIKSFLCGGDLAIKECCDDIALDLQKKMNMGNLQPADFDDYERKLNALFIDGEIKNKITDFLYCCIILAKHTTDSATKTNWFNIPTLYATASIKELIEAQAQTGDRQENSLNLRSILENVGLTIKNVAEISADSGTSEEKDFFMGSTTAITRDELKLDISPLDDEYRKLLERFTRREYGANLDDNIITNILMSDNKGLIKKLASILKTKPNPDIESMWSGIDGNMYRLQFCELFMNYIANGKINCPEIRDDFAKFSVFCAINPVIQAIQNNHIDINIFEQKEHLRLLEYLDIDDPKISSPICEKLLEKVLNIPRLDYSYMYAINKIIQKFEIKASLVSKFAEILSQHDLKYIHIWVPFLNSGKIKQDDESFKAMFKNSLSLNLVKATYEKDKIIELQSKWVSMLLNGELTDPYFFQLFTKAIIINDINKTEAELFYMHLISGNKFIANYLSEIHLFLQNKRLIGNDLFTLLNLITKESAINQQNKLVEVIAVFAMEGKLPPSVIQIFIRAINKELILSEKIHNIIGQAIKQDKIKDIESIKLFCRAITDARITNHSTIQIFVNKLREKKANYADYKDIYKWIAKSIKKGMILYPEIHKDFAEIILNNEINDSNIYRWIFIAINRKIVTNQDSQKMFIKAIAQNCSDDKQLNAAIKTIKQGLININVCKEELKLLLLKMLDSGKITDSELLSLLKNEIPSLLNNDFGKIDLLDILYKLQCMHRNNFILLGNPLENKFNNMGEVLLGTVLSHRIKKIDEFEYSKLDSDTNLRKEGKGNGINTNVPAQNLSGSVFQKNLDCNYFGSGKLNFGYFIDPKKIDIHMALTSVPSKTWNSNQDLEWQDDPYSKSRLISQIFLNMKSSIVVKTNHSATGVTRKNNQELLDAFYEHKLVRQFNCKVIVEDSMESKWTYPDNDEFSADNTLLITNNMQTLKWRNDSISIKDAIAKIDASSEKLSSEEIKMFKSNFSNRKSFLPSSISPLYMSILFNGYDEYLKTILQQKRRNNSENDTEYNKLTEVLFLPGKDTNASDTQLAWFIKKEINDQSINQLKNTISSEHKEALSLILSKCEEKKLPLYIYYGKSGETKLYKYTSLLHHPKFAQFYEKQYSKESSITIKAAVIAKLNTFYEGFERNFMSKTLLDARVMENILELSDLIKINDSAINKIFDEMIDNQIITRELFDFIKFVVTSEDKSDIKDYKSMEAIKIDDLKSELDIKEESKLGIEINSKELIELIRIYNSCITV